MLACQRLSFPAIEPVISAQGHTWRVAASASAAAADTSGPRNVSIIARAQTAPRFSSPLSPTIPTYSHARELRERGRMRKYPVKAQEDEDRVLDAIKHRPELLDSFSQIFGRKKHQANCDELVLELDCTADVLKKVWQKVRHADEAKKAQEPPTETRPRSARSCSIEPRETRRSLRSQSIDKTISTIMPESTDNSCASSVCGSPRSEEKPRQQTRRSTRRNLGAISEDDINLSATTSSASSADLTHQQHHHHQQQQHQQEDEEAATVVAASVSGNGGTDQRQSAAAAAAAVADDVEQLGRQTSSSPSRARHEELSHVPDTTSIVSSSSCGGKQSRSLRFSEPTQTPRNSLQSYQQTRRASTTMICGGSAKALRMSGAKVPANPNPDDPTRIFFDSIGLTVAAFPQHLQASVKAQVSNIVHELEYELSSPGADKIDKHVAIAV